MLARISREINRRKGPVNLKELSEKLHIEQEALAGMINFLAHKGKLQKGVKITNYRQDQCTSRPCAASVLCAGKQACKFSSDL
jgi:predicted transcriptional regulator